MKSQNRRRIVISIALIVLAICSFVLVGCLQQEQAPPQNGGSSDHIHSLIAYDGKEATCTEAGWKPYEVCSECGYTTYEEIPAKGHSFESAGIVRYATLEGGAGTQEFRCAECGKAERRVYTVENSAEEGVEEISVLANKVVSQWSAFYEEEFVQIEVTVSGNGARSVPVHLYFAPQTVYPMRQSDAYMAEMCADGSSCLSIFNGSDYSSAAPFNLNWSVKSEEESLRYTIYLPYSDMSVSASECFGNFVFYPQIGDVGYKEINAFVEPRYCETWLCLNTENRIYYSQALHKTELKNWEKPSFAGHDSMFVAVIKETTPEAAIVSMALAEEAGAQGFDLHLQYLDQNGTLNEDSLRSIIRSTRLPILALYYDGSLTQQQRLDGLKLAARCGAAAVDMQGFMFWVGSTINSQTAANISYYEKQGYDMSFTSARPSETVCDPDTIAEQMAYIAEIHSLGSEVLMSVHANVTFTSEQAVALAKFVEMRGVDIVKIVGIGNTRYDLQQCVEACSRMSEELDIRFSYHLSGAESVYVSRILCPIFYGSYVAFCFPQLTPDQDANQMDLEAAVACLTDIGLQTEIIDIETALDMLSEVGPYAQLSRIIEAYRSAPASWVAKGYGAESNLDHKWSADGNTLTLLMKDSAAVNNFNLRAYAFNPEEYSEEIAISAYITGTFYPFVASNRNPRIGVYLGTEEKMLAFVYDTDKQALQIVSNDGAFSFDDPKGDRLVVDEALSASVEYELQTDFSNGGEICLAIQKTNDSIAFYAAENKEAALQKVCEVALTEDVLQLFENDGGKCYAGVLAEVYLGSLSKGKENIAVYQTEYSI